MVIRLGLGLFLVLLGVGGIFKHAGWLLLNWFLLEIFIMVLTWAHELGHAWAGRALGIRVFRINLGLGRTLLSRRIFGFETVFKAVPLGGSVLGVAQYPSWARLREFGFVLGGPAVHVVLGAAMLWFVPIGQLWQFEPFRQGLAPVPVFFYANAALLLTSLIPRGADGASAAKYSDGNLLCEALFKKSNPKSIEATHCLMEAVVLMEARKPAEAMPWLDRGLVQYPENLNLLNQRAHCLYEQRRWEEAREAQLALLTREDLPAETRDYLLNGVAYTDAILDREELLPEADRCSLEAMAGLGWNSGVKGTRGVILMLLGRIPEGMPLLVESLEQTDYASGQAENHCWLAMGHARLRETVEARKHVEEARRLQPDCFLLERAEREAVGAVSSGAVSSGAVSSDQGAPTAPLH